MAYSSSLSAGELVDLRAGDHTVKRYLSLVPLSSVGTARINQSSFDVPLAQLTIDNTSGSFTSLVKGGMTAWIGTTAGARDIGVYRVRKTPGATTLYIQEMSNGDPGLLASRDLQPLSDNAYITIYEGENVWSVASRIEYSGGVDTRVGTFYKDYDTAYTDQNETGGDVPCILNIGNHRTGFVDTTTGLLATEWTADTYIWDGATVSTYLWNVDGGTITVGSTSTQDITVTHTYGNYLIECTVTLSTGAVIIARRWVIASDPTNHPPIEIQVSSDRRDIYGRRMSIRVIDSVASILAGQMAIYWEVATWNGDTVASASTQFVGFVKSYSGQNEPNATSETLELVSALELLKETAAFGQQLVVASDPSSWTEVTSTLSHVDFFIMYLLYWHTSILRLFDYEPVLLQSYVTQAWKVDGGNLFQQLQNAGARLNVTVGQGSNGTIFARRDLVMMSQTARDLKIVRATLDESDIQSISPSYSVRNRVGKVLVSGFYYDSGTLTPLLAVSPGNVGGQGSEIARLEGQLVTISGGQAELGERGANEFARLNNPMPDATIVIPYNFDVIEPAEKYWLTLDLDTAYTHNAYDYNGRGFVTAVTVTHEENGKKKISLNWTRESAGVDTDAEAVPVQLPSSGNAPYLEGNSYTLLPTTPYNLTTGLLSFTPTPLATPPYTVAPPTLTPPETGTGILVIGQGLTVKITTGVSAGTPSFTTAHNPGSGKNFVAFIYDGTNVYALYDDGTSSYLYLIATITGTPSPTLKQTLTNRKTGLTRRASSVANSVGVVSQTDRGTWTKTFDFTVTDGNFELVQDFQGNGDLGIYTGGTGWVAEQHSNSHWYCFCELVIPEAELTDVSWDGYSVSSLSAGADGFQIGLYTDSTTIDDQVALVDTGSGVLNGSESGTWSGVTKVRLRIGVTNKGSNNYYINSLTLEGTGENPFGTVKHYYSSDSGTTLPNVSVGDYRGDSPAYDYDDYNLGVALVAADHNVYYASTYTGAFAALSGLTGEGDTVTCIRIPYLKLATQAANSSSTSLQFIYATNAGYLGGVTFNASSGAIAVESDMSITISATDYYVIGEGALETYADNTQIIFALVKPVGGGDTKLVRSTDGGTTWEIRSTVDATHVHIVEPAYGGNGLKLYVSGAVGVKYSSNGGAQLLTKTATASLQSHYLGLA